MLDAAIRTSKSIQELKGREVYLGIPESGRLETYMFRDGK
tara:strand:- start:88108 stop:88227 length:120 start_codon:yes stop_codon:yes gene_type:complete